MLFINYPMIQGSDPITLAH